MQVCSTQAVKNAASRHCHGIPNPHVKQHACNYGLHAGWPGRASGVLVLMKVLALVWVLVLYRIP